MKPILLLLVAIFVGSILVALCVPLFQIGQMMLLYKTTDIIRMVGLERVVDMIVGLTGGIGSGKSAVSAQMKALGIMVVDADQVAKDVVVMGSPALERIAQHFGVQILLEDGTLNRAKLRQCIFADKVQKQWLEALLHPLISIAISQQLVLASSIYVVLESPLLLETSQHKTTDFVVVVDTSEELQRERACQRDGATKEQIDAVIHSQMTRQKRLDKAHWVIDNRQDLIHLKAQVLLLHDHLCKITERLL